MDSKTTILKELFLLKRILLQFLTTKDSESPPPRIHQWPIVQSCAGYCFSIWYKLESPGKRESQLRDYLHQIGLYTSLWGID